MNVKMLDWSDGRALGDLDGSVALGGAQGGSDGMRAFVSEGLVGAFGGAILDEVTALSPTGWQDNPFVRGAYSAVRPGYAQARRDLIAQHTGRIAFAGEAFALIAESTAHGAYQSGQDVVARLIAEEL